MNQEIQRLLEQHYAAWSKGDVEGILACFTDDCVFEDMALQAKFEGKEGVRGFAQATFAAIPDFRWTPTIILIDGSRAGTEWRMTGTQTGDFPGIPGTGKSFSVPGSSVLEIRAGKIHQNRDYWSLATYLGQMGLMPKTA
jgi:steroid delta-isomerase-like uncharacterized protein